MLFLLILTAGDCHKAKSKRKQKPICGDTLTEPYGVIQTPNFPSRFPVPIECKWIIDASNVPSNNASIIVYLTQMYVVNGLTFTESAHYYPGSKFNRVIHTVTGNENVTETKWIQTHTPYLIIDFTMDVLEGNQFRALGGLLDVFGFNITYEISTRAEPVRNNSCIVIECSLLGHCYTSSDLS